MIWLFILSFLALLIVPRRFRLHALVVLILLALGGFLLSRPGEEAGAMRNRIPIEQVTVVQMDLRPSRGVGHELVGKVINQSSSYTLLGLGIELIIKDCVEGDANIQSPCTVLAKMAVPVALSIPPGEAGKFNKRLYFKELHPQGRIRWQYTLVYTEARK